jgi:choice-of-anchor A domain-containing protein
MTALRTKPAPLRLDRLETRETPAVVYDLGPAAAFNAFVFGRMDAHASDAEGRVAVGGDARFAAYGIGDRLPNSHGSRDDLVVGGKLDFTDGQVFFGNVVHGGTGTLVRVGIPNGDARQDVGVIDFAAAQAELTATSAALATEAANGRTTARWGTLTLRGTHAGTNIFSLSAEQLAAARAIKVITPFGSSVLINVSGDAVQVRDLGLHLRGADCSTVLWNFPEADELTVSGVGLAGSVLAPSAALDFYNGQIRGTVVAASMFGNGQFNLCPSTFQFEVPDAAGLRGAVFLDMDGDNERGDPAVDVGLDGADVYLTGRDALGRPVSRYALSWDEGRFQFDALWPGTYAVSVVPPQRYETSTLLGIPGTVDGTPVGTGEVNRVHRIRLGAGDDGIDYLLPLLPDQN